MATRGTAERRRRGVVLTTTKSRVVAAVATSVVSLGLLAVAEPVAALAVAFVGLSVVARAPEPQSVPHCLVPVPSSGTVTVRAARVSAPGPVPGSSAVA